MAKRLSEKEKTNLVKGFTNGQTIDDLTQQYHCSKLTVVRNLKKRLGEKKYEELINQEKEIKQAIPIQKDVWASGNKDDLGEENLEEYSYEKESFEESLPLSSFIEITPLNCEIENSLQKDLSSVPLDQIDFPNIVYMIVDKKIELQTKYLKEYPEWQFLSEEELSRKTIEIFFDLKMAKRFCNKEQKVIKVPNTDVFKIAAPILLQKGISRIVSSDKLISL